MKTVVIFDVDGTLLNTEKIYMQAWSESAMAFGYQIPEQALLQTRAVSRAVAIAKFKEFCGEDFPFEAIRKGRVRIAEEIIMNTPAEELRMPYARETLQLLRDRGYILATASSTDYATGCSHLEHAGLLDLFHAIVGGDMVQRGKPEPDIFLKAAEMCGASPENCILVGDTPADALGGTAAGMDVILIPDQVPANEQTTRLSRQILNNLNELPGALGTLGKKC